jgi:hypothetical protein
MPMKRFPPQADTGYRASNALIPHDEPIVIPRDAGELVQYEGEPVEIPGIGVLCNPGVSER